MGLGASNNYCPGIFTVSNKVYKRVVNHFLVNLQNLVVNYRARTSIYKRWPLASITISGHDIICCHIAQSRPDREYRYNLAAMFVAYFFCFRGS